MKSQAYFEKIHKQIEIRLQESQTSIRLAVAWFTDQKLFDIICEKAKNGIKVELIIANHEINQDSSIDFRKLKQNEGSLYWIGKGYKYEALMHNKFCIIDNRVLITGSYNWTQKAKSNHESITVIEEDDNLIFDFNQEFDKIINKYFNKENVEIDWGKVIIRLETLLNVIRLEDEEDINYQSDKIKSLLLKKATDEKTATISSILNLCKKKEFSSAVNAIQEFTRIYKQITIYQDPLVPALQLEIRGLEFQVSSLEDEKTDIEKLISNYQSQYNIELGDLIKKILLLKKQLAKFDVEQDKENEEKQKEYNEASSDYDDFSKSYEENLKEPKPFELNEEKLKELKQNYRKATKLCHPDKVTDGQKEQAQRVFTELKTAYDNNDLEKVNDILANLEKGIFKSQGETITQKDKLLIIKQELELKRKVLVESLHKLKISDVYQKIGNLDDWEAHFLLSKQKFTRVLESLQNKYDKVSYGE
ncbi:phospholipase D-like domain-containing protein [Flavobacterium sp. CAN_S2]|uniref:phospholipase D-like domain-containing protein n=1 Tax=Flavobacterium sp. CAN_S2 TaxID=2787726 RepID=UPI0018C8ED4B